MSTRSVTTIRGPHGSVALYRHHDGYLAETGGAIIEALKGATAAETVAGRLLAMMYDDRQPARPVYELTSSAEGHGDLDHVYEVTATWDRQVNGLVFTIRHGRRPNHDAWTFTTYSVVDFTVIVNADRAAINRRMSESENREIRNAERYPMFPVEA
jgi:hypothetical protein